MARHRASDERTDKAITDPGNRWFVYNFNQVWDIFCQRI